MKKGFTIIEIVIAISIVGLLLPLFISVFLNITRMQVQLSALQEIKEEGDFVQSQIIQTIRNSGSIVDDSCSSVPSLPPSRVAGICLLNKDSVGFGYIVDAEGKISSYSANLAQPITLLGSDNEVTFPVRVSNVSFFVVDFNTVGFRYTVTYTPRVDSLPTQSLPYEFFVHLRS